MAGNPYDWLRQAEEYAHEIADAGGRPVVLLAESREGRYPHILFLEIGWDVHLSPFVDKDTAYMMDGRYAFPTDEEMRKQIDDALKQSWLLGTWRS